jgi:hypothetical protein
MTNPLDAHGNHAVNTTWLADNAHKTAARSA